MPNTTHRRELAKKLSAATSISYQEALRQVRAAGAAGLLPGPFTEETYPHYINILTAHAVSRRSGLPQSASGLQLALGTTMTGELFGLQQRELAMHVLLLESPDQVGHPKQNTLRALIRGALNLGWSGVVLNLGGSRSTNNLSDWCRQFSTDQSVSYQELSSSPTNASTWIKPFANIDSDQATKMVTGLLGGQDTYWKAVNRKVVSQLMVLLTEAAMLESDPYPPLNLEGVIAMMSEVAAGSTATKQDTTIMIERVLAESQSTLYPSDFTAITDPTRAEIEAALGIYATLSNLSTSKTGRDLLRPKVGAGPRSVYDPDHRGLTYVALEFDDSRIDQLVSSSVLASQTALASTRTAKRDSSSSRRFVVVENFDQADSTLVEELMSRARSGDVTVILSTSTADWPDDTFGTPLELFAQNCNVLLAETQPGSPHTKRLAQLFDTVAQSDPTDPTDPTAGSQRIDQVSADQLSKLPDNQILVQVAVPPRFAQLEVASL
jgi:hypothetical protein